MRCRISEIELKPLKSKRKVKIEVLIDNKVVHELPLVKDGHPLRWSKLIVCDGAEDSRLQIIVSERNNRMYTRYPSTAYPLSEVSKLSATTMGFANTAWAASVKFLGQEEATKFFENSREVIQRIKLQRNPSDKHGKIREVFKSMLEFGSFVAEAHPSAEVVFSVCVAALEKLEKEEQYADYLGKLADRLFAMTELVQIAKDHARIKHLHNLIDAFLTLMEDVGILVLEYEKKGALGERSVVSLPHSYHVEANVFIPLPPEARAVHGFAHQSDQERADELARRFQTIREDFHLSLTAQTTKTVAITENREVLNRLNPVELSGYDPTRICQDGTRLGVLTEIMGWIQGDGNFEASLFWLYGQAGIGKSSIAHSICDRLSNEGRNPVSYFCKRDDPALRDPLRLLNNIVYGLCSRCPPYAKIVIEAIQKNPELCVAHLGVRYMALVREPLRQLRNLPAPEPFVVIIDALDECGNNETRKQILGLLQDMVSESSGGVDWIKLVITSRPTQDISAFFCSGGPSIFRCNVETYSATEDIRAYMELHLGTIAVQDNWPAGSIGKLSDKAGGLFIWAATTCKFVVEGYDSHERLHQVLGGNSMSGAFGGLDKLYETVIGNSILDGREDNTRLVRRCIGAILATSNRQPLPIPALAKMLQGKISEPALRRIVAALGSVVYTDQKFGGAVRFYHPSFADFVLDKKRSGNFHVEIIRNDADLATGSLLVLRQELYFNICGLETSHLLNSEIEGFDSRTQNSISAHLAYSCTYWIDHAIASSEACLFEKVEELLNGPHVLYWLETLSLLGRTVVAIQELPRLTGWLMPTSAELAAYSQDIYRFVSTFFDPISASTPHLYLSALAFAPRRSKIIRKLGHHFPNLVSVTKGQVESWPRWLRAIQHPAPVVSVSVSPDGQKLATGCVDGTIRIWHPMTGELLMEPFVGHSDVVRSVRFSHNSTQLVSASFDKTVRVWDCITGKPVGPPYVGHTHKVTTASFSPNGSRVVSGSYDCALRVWNTDTGEVLGSPLTKPVEINHIIVWAEFLPDGVRIMAASFGATVSIWDSITGNMLSSIILSDRYEPDALGCAAPSPDGNFFACGSSFGQNGVSIWDINRSCFLETKRMLVEESPSSVVFSPDNRLVAASSANMLYLWDARTGDPINTPLIGHSDEIHSITFSPDGRFIFSASSDQTVRVWDVESHDPPVSSLVGPSHWVECVAFSSDGTRIASGHGFEDKTVQVWNVKTGYPMGGPLTEHTAYVQHVTFAPDDTHVLSTSFGEVHMCSLTSGVNCSPESPRTEFTGPSSASVAKPTPNGGVLLLGLSDSGDLESWDSETQKVTLGPLIHPLPMTPRLRFSVAFSIDGSRAVFPFPDHALCIWDLKSRTTVGSLLEGHSSTIDCITFSPDDTRIASVSRDHTVRIWDVTTCNEIAHWRSENVGNYSEDTASVYCITFSADGSRVFTGSWDGYIRTWDPNTGAELMPPLVVHADTINCVSVSRDNKYLASASNDKSICIWDISDPLECPRWPRNSSGLAPHPIHAPWTSHDQSSLLLWLPPHYRRPHEPRLVHRISKDPLDTTIDLDFSRFVHGTSWTSVACPEVRTGQEAPK